MLGGALGQLFRDLANIADGRSPYEEALYQELLELAKDTEPPWNRRLMTFSSVLQSMERTPSFQLEVDSRPGQEDVKRLKCSRADCPNKRL